MTIKKNGFIYKYDFNGKVKYIKNPNNLQMWFNKNENLIKARWANGYEQKYDGKGHITSVRLAHC